MKITGYLSSNLNSFWFKFIQSENYNYGVILTLFASRKYFIRGELRANSASQGLVCWGPPMNFFHPLLYLTAAGKVKKVAEISRENMSFKKSIIKFYTHTHSHKMEDTMKRKRVRGSNSCLIFWHLSTDKYANIRKF